MVDRRRFVQGLAAAGLWASAEPRAWAMAAAVSRFSVHEPTEISWIIASLTPLGKERGGSVRRDTPYFAAVERWFARVAEHPAIAALGSDYNLPRLVGNAADYRFGAGGRLVRSAGAGSLWDDPEGDLFTKYRPDIEEFSRRSDARRFLAVQSRALRASQEALHKAVDMSDIRSWLEAQFLERPAPVEVFVSPLTSGWNYTNLGGAQPRIWVPAPRTGSLEDPVERFKVVSSVFTEVDHIYVNPVTRLYLSEVATVFADNKTWVTDATWADYPSAELVFNEYMTWSVFLEYARDRLSARDYDVLATRIVRFMEDSRGFIRFGIFAVTVRRNNTGKLQEAFPSIISQLG